MSEKPIETNPTFLYRLSLDDLERLIKSFHGYVSSREAIMNWIDKHVKSIDNE